MSYVIAFLSASVFILFLAVTEVRAETCKPPGTGPGYGRLDFVNIGTLDGPDGEEAHEAAGWGPREPAAHGGNWGNIADDKNCDLPDHNDCDWKTRVTWAGECFKIKETGQIDTDCLPPAGTQPKFSFDPPTPYEPDSFALLGRAARVVLDPNALVGHGGKARQLRMRVLDGIGYDAFEVFVRNIKKTNDEEGVIPAKVGGDTTVLVYRFDPYAPENLNTKTKSGKSELWRVHTIDLIAYVGQLNLHSEPNALEVIIQSTAAPWGLFYYQNSGQGQGGYGQLAVDWIEILGTPKKPLKH
jgi:hypothetical protein